MMMAALRLNIPANIVSGGLMLAGRFKGKVDLISVFAAWARCRNYDAELPCWKSARAWGRLCAGMFTANSMNRPTSMGLDWWVNDPCGACRADHFAKRQERIVDR
jgi:dihydroxyacid dehydratase/phosphogluconate dehydratase